MIRPIISIDCKNVLVVKTNVTNGPHAIIGMQRRSLAPHAMLALDDCAPFVTKSRPGALAFTVDICRRSAKVFDF
jgi:hypothetical protein